MPNHLPETASVTTSCETRRETFGSITILNTTLSYDVLFPILAYPAGEQMATFYALVLP
jgi:hypothetical protein